MWFPVFHEPRQRHQSYEAVKVNMPSLRGEKQNTLRTHQNELVSAGEEREKNIAVRRGREDLGVNTYYYETAGIVNYSVVRANCTLTNT